MRKVTLPTLAIAAGILLWIGVFLMVLISIVGTPSISLATPTVPLRTLIALRGTPTPIKEFLPLPSETPTATHTSLPTQTPKPQLTATPRLIIIAANVAEVTPATQTDLPTAAANALEGSTQPACTPPEGWVAYSVQPGDTLFGFVVGADGTVDVNGIMVANCLETNFLSVGQTVFLPPGAGENAPKLDDPSASNGGDADRLTRPSNCPCQIRLREGLRLEQIADTVDKLPAGFTGRDFLAATAAGVSTPDYWFLRSRPADKTLEGYMYPGTYTIEAGMTAVQFRDMLLNAFNANVPQDFEGAAQARGMTFWQALNFASIVQRESWDANEQRMISGVIHNRMAAGKGIAASVTMMYALGGPGQWWKPAGQINFNLPNPYNTNRYKGLPPSPICSPGVSAISATLNPVPHDYQYFNTKCGGGGNFYARTFEEFKAGLACK